MSDWAVLDEFVNNAKPSQSSVAIAEQLEARGGVRIIVPADV